MAKDKYEEFLASARESLEYWTEVGILDFTEDLCALMDQNNVSRTELADLIGNSPAYITKVLRGNVNFTLATMTKLARALNAVVHVHLSPEGAIAHWKDEITNESPKDVDFPGLLQIKAEAIADNDNSDSPLKRVVWARGN